MLKTKILNRLKRVASLPADIALKATNMPSIFSKLERRYEASIYTALPHSALSSIETEIVTGLERKGLFVTNLTALGLEENGLLDTGRRLAEIVSKRVTAMGDTLPHHIEASPSDMMDHSEIFRAGLDISLLRIAEAYLRQPVAYDGALLFYTPADGHERGTRQWHLDREDRRIMKVALYLHDVDMNGGPFEILHWMSRKSCTPYHYRPLYTAELEDSLQCTLTNANTSSCIGAAGTLVFADTARFYHRGRPATESPRSAVFFSYFSRMPRHPFFCARSRLSYRRLKELTIGLSSVQRDAALWRKGLPWVARLVPPSLV